MTLSTLLLLGRALAADEGDTGEPVQEIVVIVDDRAGRSMTDPVVRLRILDGDEVSVTLADDGVDPRDAFAGDHLWVGRGSLPVGAAGVAVLTEGEAGQGETVASTRFAASGQGDALLRLRVSASRTSTEAPLARTEDQQALAEIAKSNLRFPISPVQLQAGESPELRQWTVAASDLVIALVAVGGALALVAAGGAASGPPPRGGDPSAYRWTRWAWLGLAGVVAVAAGVWLPMLPRLGTSFAGIEYVDHYGTQWFYWLVDWSLRTGSEIGHTDRNFFPWGKDIFKHTGANVLDAYAAIPFRRMFGPVLGYNVFVLGGHLATGVAFWRLVRRFVDDRLACAVATLCFSLQPYFLLELTEGRPTQSVALFPVLFTTSVLELGRAPRWRTAFLGGLWLALAGYQYWFYAVFGGVMAAVHGAWRLVADPSAWPERRRLLGMHVAMAAVAFAFVAPTVGPMLVLTMSGSEVPGLLDADSWSMASAAPLTAEGLKVGLFSWQPLQNAAGMVIVDVDGNNLFLAQNAIFPTMIFVALAVWWIRPGNIPRGPVTAMLVALALLAIGPVVLVGHLGLPNPAYIWLVKGIRFLRRLWWPMRAICYSNILLSLCLAQAVTWLRGQRGFAQAAGLGLLALDWTAVLRDARVLPFPTWDATIPAGYRCLANGGQGALIELPFAWTQAHLYFQTLHERPLFGGMLEDNTTFAPPAFTAFRKANPVTSRLLAGDPLGEPYDWEPEDLQPLRDLNFEYVVVQKDAYLRYGDFEGADRLAILQQALALVFQDPVYDDARVAIYALFDAPAPCDLESFIPDAAAYGITEAQQQVRELDRERQGYRWWSEATSDVKDD